MAQLGRGAGFYSYDRLDNAGGPSAERIVPELQNTRLGDILPSRPGSPHGFEVLRMEPPRLFLLGAHLRVPGFASIPWEETWPTAYIRSTWLFLLREHHGATGLVVRTRAIVRPWWLRIIVNSLMAPTHVAMQRKQLLNLRHRIERFTRDNSH